MVSDTPPTSLRNSVPATGTTQRAEDDDSIAFLHVPSSGTDNNAHNSLVKSSLSLVSALRRDYSNIDPLIQGPVALGLRGPVALGLRGPVALGLRGPVALLSLRPQWGAADAEIKVPSGENRELKRYPFKAWSRSVLP